MIPIISNHPDAQIGDGVYIAYQWIGDPADGNLISLFIGTSAAGPILHYVTDGNNRWDGRQRRNYYNGAWTPLYSYGNYGKRYAYGGNWTGHAMCIHPDIQAYCRQPQDNVSEQLLIAGKLHPLPDGIKGDIKLTDIDCSVGWPIWYGKAIDAIDARLTRGQIATAHISSKVKSHLLSHETNDIIYRVRETMEAYIA